ncbi:MAG: MmcQ/YjbR family DNA-binding protein [Chloroflexi bacterium AL-W]|nr:MmcQ/YjbR family DNA-binding protein [Chloroflexi bacterium AL-W]
MNIESLRLYCLAKPGTTEGFPFGEDTLVFKVMGKLFALTSLDNPVSVNLKADPPYSIALREEYPERIRPGFHMNKTHWNTVSLIDNLPEELIRSLVDHSYDMVVKTLKKSEKEQLARLSGQT